MLNWNLTHVNYDCSDIFQINIPGSSFNLAQSIISINAWQCDFYQTVFKVYFWGVMKHVPDFSIAARVVILIAVACWSLYKLPFDIRGNFKAL